MRFRNSSESRCMKRITLLAVLFCLIGLSGFAQLIDSPAATVNLTKPEFISVKQVSAQIEAIEKLKEAGITGVTTEPMEVLESMIQEVLLKQGAEQAGVRLADAELNAELVRTKTEMERIAGRTLSDQEFRQLALANTGLTWDAYTDSLRTQRITVKYIQATKQELFDEIPPPSEKDIDDQYRKNATQFVNPEYMRVSEIFVDTRNLGPTERQKARERAEGILRSYNNGEGTFEELALTHSDNTETRYKGGDAGYIPRNDPRMQVYGAAFFDAIFDLEVGDISDVIQSKLGFHILKGTDHRDPKLLTLDDPINPVETTTLREFIRQRLVAAMQQQVFGRAMKELADELRTKADVEIFEENLENIR